MLVGIGLVGLVLFGAQKYLFNRNSEPGRHGPPSRSRRAQPRTIRHPNPARWVSRQASANNRRRRKRRPRHVARKAARSHAPERQKPTAPTRAANDATEAAPQARSDPPPPRAAPDSSAALTARNQGLRTKRAVLDRPAGRASDHRRQLFSRLQNTVHAAAQRGPACADRATRLGIGPTRGCFNVPQDGDLFLRLSKSSGTLSITSEPPGATIEVDGTVQGKRTPSRVQSGARACITSKWRGAELSSISTCSFATASSSTSESISSSQC